MRRSQTTLSFDDRIVDETTAMLSRRLFSNYQAVQRDADELPRLRKSVYAHSQASVVEEPTQAAEESDPNSAEPMDPTFWKKAISPFLSIELENKGSVARDHLALGNYYVVFSLEQKLADFRRADISCLA